MAGLDMKTLFLVAIVFGNLFGVNFLSAQTWIQATNAPNQDWAAIASSSDGVKLVAVVDKAEGIGQGMYASTNSGVTWMLLTNSPSVGWETIASSADGHVIVGGSGYGLIYTSTNSGFTWMSNNVANTWVSVASSGDGSKLAAVDFNDALIYISTNSGASWVSNTVPTSDNSSSFGLARAVCCSADGTKLVVATLGGAIFTSTNSGANWAAADAPLTNWSSVASSANGSKLAAVCAGGGIYTSIDSGFSWIVQTNAPNEDWYSITVSAVGSKLTAVAGGDAPGGGVPGPIYTSSDFGITWKSNNVSDTFWYSVTSSADGCKKAAVVNGGGIWTLQITPLPQLNIASVSTNLALSWTIPSTNFVLQQSSNLTSWSSITNACMLNFTNLQNQVTLPPTNRNGFFRLVSQ